MNIDQFENIALDTAIYGAKIKKQILELLRQFDIISKDYEDARQQLAESIGEPDEEERKMFEDRFAKLGSRMTDAINEIISDEEEEEFIELHDEHFN